MKRLKDWNPTFWQAHLISLRIGIGVVLLMLLASLDLNSIVQMVLYVLGFLLFVIGLAIEYRFWRCPFCGKQLPMRGGSLEFCSACGAKLEKE